MDRDRWICLLEVTKQFSSRAAPLVPSAVSEVVLPSELLMFFSFFFFNLLFPAFGQGENYLGQVKQADFRELVRGTWSWMHMWGFVEGTSQHEQLIFHFKLVHK